MTTLAFRGRTPCFAIPEIHPVHFLKEEGIPVGKCGFAALPGAGQQNHALPLLRDLRGEHY